MWSLLVWFLVATLLSFLSGTAGQAVDGPPPDIVNAGMAEFTSAYNDLTIEPIAENGGAASLYAAETSVTVNGGSTAGGTDLTSPAEVATFLTTLRGAHPNWECTDIEFNVVKIKQNENVHWDTWKCTTGIGSCKATWAKQSDGATWKIAEDEILFFPYATEMPADFEGAVRGHIAEFARAYGAKEWAAIQGLYADKCLVYVNSGEVFIGNTPLEVTTFLDTTLRTVLGIVAIVFPPEKVEPKFEGGLSIHTDTWFGYDSKERIIGQGTCTAVWQKENDDWKIVRDIITFGHVVPPEIVNAGMAAFTTAYNDLTSETISAVGGAASLYASTTSVTVNGGAPMMTPADVADFLTRLRGGNLLDGLGACNNIMFNVVKIDQNIHWDTWECTAGIGSSKATWANQGDSTFKITTDEILFYPYASEMPPTFQGVVNYAVASIATAYKAKQWARIQSLYADACLVYVNSGMVFIGNTPLEVTSFLDNTLRTAFGITELVFPPEDVKAKFEGGLLIHTDTWSGFNANGSLIGTGTCRAIWQQTGGVWEIVRDEITFTPTVFTVRFYNDGCIEGDAASGAIDHEKTITLTSNLGSDCYNIAPGPVMSGKFKCAPNYTLTNGVGLQVHMGCTDCSCAAAPNLMPFNEGSSWEGFEKAATGKCVMDGACEQVIMVSPPMVKGSNFPDCQNIALKPVGYCEDIWLADIAFRMGAKSLAMALGFTTTFLALSL